ncbi:MAG: hypothetical protein N2202_10220, partial [Proteobacteria bacterium]|nr:hypothetical protein [Pseudomonadota bacterium]
VKKAEAINRILDYTFSIPSYVKRLERVQGLKAFEIYWLKADYSQELGLYDLSGDSEVEGNIL